MAPGETRTNIFAMADKGWRAVAGGGAQKLRRQRGNQREQCADQNHGGVQLVNWWLSRSTPTPPGRLAMVLFHDAQPARKPKPMTGRINIAGSLAYLQELEEELKNAKKTCSYHRGVEAANEELHHQRGVTVYQRRATIHQRRAGNFQGGAAMLNEELVTVNSELQTKLMP